MCENSHDDAKTRKYIRTTVSIKCLILGLYIFRLPSFFPKRSDNLLKILQDLREATLTGKVVTIGIHSEKNNIQIIECQISNIKF
jgi:hypothetical protein